MRNVPSMPRSVRAPWLLGVFPAFVVGILADPAGAIQATGLEPLLAEMAGAAVVQLWAIWSELR